MEVESFVRSAGNTAISPGYDYLKEYIERADLHFTSFTLCAKFLS